jgi:hypothetical protein
MSYIPGIWEGCPKMFEKLKYGLSLFESNEILIIFTVLLVYHVVLVGVCCLSIRAWACERVRRLEAERVELKGALESRDVVWEDRQDELRKILTGEKEREVLQLKAEYDSYVNLLEEKLMNSRSPGTARFLGQIGLK